MTDHPLFRPFTLGSIELANRIVMAPMTRSRAGAGLLPGELAATYYSQRATAGLLITEATQVSPQAQGQQDTPGLYTPAQIEGWRRVTDAVHARGGRIFVQLWHVGRVAHVDVQPNAAAPVAPSAIRAKTRTFVHNEFVEVSEPRALALDEIPGIVADFRQAAANAMRAGFDGVEVHGANGYLIEQFIKDGANHRTDAYGGSIENRARLLLEVTEAIAQEIGAARVGVRISPMSTLHDVSCSDPQAQYNHIATALSTLGVAYLHVVEGGAPGGPRDTAFDHAALRERFAGAYLGNNGYTLELARSQLDAGRVDLVAFGRPFIANPDLVARLRSGHPLQTFNPARLYGGGAEGYTDFPAMGA